MDKRIAVIDLGSNSVRMSINVIHDDGTWACLSKDRATVRLSEGMGFDRVLQEDAMQRVIKALREFCAKAKLDSCQTIAAIATAAVRTAVNKDEFINRVAKETGIKFDIISGEDEAYYSYLSVVNSLPIKNGLIFDTGGGSTELILVKDRRLIKSASLPLGAVIMTEMMKKRHQSEMYRYVMTTLGSVSWIDEAEGFDLYGVGGSAKTLATLSLKELRDVDSLHGHTITYSKAAGIYQKLYNTPVDLRINIPGMDPGRADVILAGLTPMKALMDMLGSKKIVISSNGVKEGVFFRVHDEIMKNDWSKSQ